MADIFLFQNTVKCHLCYSQAIVLLTSNGNNSHTELLFISKTKLFTGKKSLVLPTFLSSSAEDNTRDTEVEYFPHDRLES